MILSLSAISKAFQGVPVLQQVSFGLEEYDKAALVGINGAGKTTLLRIIMGEMEADSGLVTFAKGKTLGYLAQDKQIFAEASLMDYLLAQKGQLIRLERRLRELEEGMKQAEEGKLHQLMEQYARANHLYESQGGYLYRSQITGILKGLGFSEADFTRPLSTLSGGQKTRIALGSLLVNQPDLLLLDEPTNHLDMGSIAWLENHLLNYRGAVLLVSHDRYFLDKIAGKVIELEQGAGTVFTGNYSEYSRKKEQLITARWKAWMKQQQEIRRQEEVIEKLSSFNREKSAKRAESRRKALAKIQAQDKPVEADNQMKLTLAPAKTSGRDVLTVEGLSKAYPGKPLFEGLGFSLKRGERVAIIGDNGTGKTTLLTILNGLLPADSGSFTLGANVTVGYYDQEHQALSREKTVMEEIADAYPGLTGTRIRNTLAAFLFTGDDVFKRISSLSGGEQGRVALAKLMLSSGNFLLLDEPTNHLDIFSREVLETAVSHYEGTVLYVSHDRYFINRTAHRILELENGRMTSYPGNYDDYREKKAALLSAGCQAAKETGAKNPKKSPAAESKGDGAAAASVSRKQEWKEKKEAEAARRKKENAIRRTEGEIALREARLRTLDEEMAHPRVCTDPVRLQELQREKDGLEAELLELMEEWEEAVEK